MRRLAYAIVILAIIILLVWLYFLPDRLDLPTAPPAEPARSESTSIPRTALPGDALLAGFGDPAGDPLEDVKKLHRVIDGYFSVVKDVTRHPIGGNADLAAALLGENANAEAFIRADHPILGPDRLLVDRWKTPFFIHPEGARDLTIRSAGPDHEMFTADDLVILPSGMPGDAMETPDQR